MGKDMMLKKLYSIMESNFVKGEKEDEYLYNGIYPVKKEKDKTLVESFFKQDQKHADECLNEIFDELHPY